MSNPHRASSSLRVVAGCRTVPMHSASAHTRTARADPPHRARSANARVSRRTTSAEAETHSPPGRFDPRGASNWTRSGPATSLRTKGANRKTSVWGCRFCCPQTRLRRRATSNPAPKNTRPTSAAVPGALSLAPVGASDSDPGISLTKDSNRTSRDAPPEPSERPNS